MPKLWVKLKIENILCWCVNGGGMRPHGGSWDCVGNDSNRKCQGGDGWPCPGMAAETREAMVSLLTQGVRRLTVLMKQIVNEVLILGQEHFADFFSCLCSFCLCEVDL